MYQKIYQIHYYNHGIFFPSALQKWENEDYTKQLYQRYPNTVVLAVFNNNKKVEFSDTSAIWKVSEKVIYVHCTYLPILTRFCGEQNPRFWG